MKLPDDYKLHMIDQLRRAVNANPDQVVSVSVFLCYVPRQEMATLEFTVATEKGSETSNSLESAVDRLLNVGMLETVSL